MNVAVPRSQHSPTLGQLASSQTVCRLSAPIIDFSRRYVGPPGVGTFSQGGLRARRKGAGSPVSRGGPPGLARERVTWTLSTTPAVFETAPFGKSGPAVKLC